MDEVKKPVRVTEKLKALSVDNMVDLRNRIPQTDSYSATQVIAVRNGETNKIPVKTTSKE